MNTEEKNPQTEAGTEPQASAEPEASEQAEKADKKDKGGFGGKKAKAEKEAMQKKLEEAEEALKKQKDQFLRTAAEYDNFRKRTEREKRRFIPTRQPQRCWNFCRWQTIWSARSSNRSAVSKICARALKWSRHS